MIQLPFIVVDKFHLKRTRTVKKLNKVNNWERYYRMKYYRWTKGI